MADRYWVGGTGTWDTTSTTNWSTSSGGASGASAPTSADSVFFDANSNTGTGSFTVTISVAVNCLDFNVGSPTALDGAMTLANNNALNVYGSWVSPSTNFTTINAGSLNFVSTTAGKTINTNGVDFNYPINFNGTGGEYTLQANLSCSNTFNLLAGNVDTSTSNYAIICQSFASSGSSIRKLDLNGSLVKITSSGWTASGSNFTLNAGTSEILFAVNGGIPNFNPNGLTYANVTFSGTNDTSGERVISGIGTIGNLKLDAGINTTSSCIIFNFTDDITISNLYCTGSIGYRRVFVKSNVLGTPRTLTCAAVSLTDTDFRDITFAGAVGTATGTRLGDCGGNSNITFAAGTNKYWNAPDGSNWGSNAWATSSGGTAAGTNIPLAQDTVIIENTGLNTGATINGWTSTTNVGNIDMSSRTNSMTFNTVGASGILNVHGNLKFGTGVTISGFALYLYNRKNVTIDSYGIGVNFTIYTNSINANVDITGNNLTTTRNFFLNNGNLNLNNYALTSLGFYSQVTNARSLNFGTGGYLNIPYGGNGGTIFNVSGTQVTVTGNAVVNIAAGAGSVATTVSSGTQSESNAFSFNFTSGTYALTFLSGTNAKDVNFSGFRGTWVAPTGAGIIYGNLTLSNAATMSSITTANLNFSGSGTQSITGNSFSITNPIIFTNGTKKLIGNLTCTRTTTLNQGTLDLNGNILFTGNFSSSNTNARTIIFNGGKIVSNSGVSGTVLDTSTLTNLTITGTPVFETTGYAVSLTTASIASISNSLLGAASLANSTPASPGGLSFTGTQDDGYWTVPLPWNFQWGNTAYSTVYVGTNTYLTFGAGSTEYNSLGASTPALRKIMVSAADNSCQRIYYGTEGVAPNRTYRIRYEGTNSTSGTLGSPNMVIEYIFYENNNYQVDIQIGQNARAPGGVTGIFEADGTVVSNSLGYAANSGQRVTFAASYISPNKIINTGSATEANAFNISLLEPVTGLNTTTYFIESSSTLGNLTLNGNQTLVNPSITVYGNLSHTTGTAATTFTAGSNIVVFGATSGTKTITTSGATLDFPINFNGAGGTWQLQDALTIGSTRYTTFTNGTVNLNGKNLTTGNANTAAGTKNITFNGGNIIITGSGATVWDNANPTNFSTTVGTGTGSISLTSSSAKTFVGANVTYNCAINQGGTGNLTITGNNTFANITNSAQPANILFTAGTTTTLTNFGLAGNVGNLITVTSATASNHTLSSGPGTIINARYCNISRSTATGGANWQALIDNGNVDGENNSGWIIQRLAILNGFFGFFDF